ncbi:MAG: ABC transporter permease [Candidatus Hydrogenedentes bacterium]|nr:ABC transporter permease [Candidatus Hydrogenedentota bacterium]
MWNEEIKRVVAKHSPLFILAGLCVLFAVISPPFRMPHNVQQVMARTTFVGVLAVGQLLVILTAGIDLSVGSVAALAGMAGCFCMKSAGLEQVFGDDSLALAALGVLAGAATGLACGLTNGLLVAKGRIPPFIVTLGMMMIARGAARLLSGGTNISDLPEVFAWLGGSRAWWFPVAITLTITAAGAVTLALARFGRYLYAVGGNREAARLSGLPVDRIRIAAYAICGLLAGFGGMVLASRTMIGSPNAAEMSELDAIAACVIGGASLMGGEGGALTSLAGALIMAVLTNFCILMGLNDNWQRVLIGSLIIALVFYDNLRKRRVGLLKE